MIRSTCEGGGEFYNSFSTLYKALRASKNLFCQVLADVIYLLHRWLCHCRNIYYFFVLSSIVSQIYNIFSAFQRINTLKYLIFQKNNIFSRI